MGSPFTITPAITSASPALWIDGSTTYLFIGLVGNIIKLNVTQPDAGRDQHQPGSAAIRGRVSATSTTACSRATTAATMWAIDPNNFTGTNRLWSYTVRRAIRSRARPTIDQAPQVLHFGTEGGKVVALDITPGRR